MSSPHTTTKSSPCSPQLEKAGTQQQRPKAAKNKINKINKFIYKKPKNTAGASHTGPSHTQEDGILQGCDSLEFTLGYEE